MTSENILYKLVSPLLQSRLDREAAIDAIKRNDLSHVNPLTLSAALDCLKDNFEVAEKLGAAIKQRIENGQISDPATLKKVVTVFCSCFDGQIRQLNNVGRLKVEAICNNLRLLNQNIEKYLTEQDIQNLSNNELFLFISHNLNYESMTYIIMCANQAQLEGLYQHYPDQALEILKERMKVDHKQKEALDAAIFCLLEPPLVDRESFTAYLVSIRDNPNLTLTYSYYRQQLLIEALKISNSEEEIEKTLQLYRRFDTERGVREIMESFILEKLHICADEIPTPYVFEIDWNQSFGQILDQCRSQPYTVCYYQKKIADLLANPNNELVETWEKYQSAASDNDKERLVEILSSRKQQLPKTVIQTIGNASLETILEKSSDPYPILASLTEDQYRYLFDRHPHAVVAIIKLSRNTESALRASICNNFSEVTEYLYSMREDLTHSSSRIIPRAIQGKEKGNEIEKTFRYFRNLAMHDGITQEVYHYLAHQIRLDDPSLLLDVEIDWINQTTVQIFTRCLKRAADFQANQLTAFLTDCRFKYTNDEIQELWKKYRWHAGNHEIRLFLEILIARDMFECIIPFYRLEKREIILKALAVKEFLVRDLMPTPCRSFEAVGKIRLILQALLGREYQKKVEEYIAEYTSNPTSLESI